MLALQAHLDLDEALLRLWDIGIDYIDTGVDSIRNRDLPKIRKTLGIPNARRLRSLKYWCGVFALSENELRELLPEFNIKMSEDASRLPKGAIRILRRETQRQLSQFNLENGPEVRDNQVGYTAPEKSKKSTIVHKSLIWENIGRIHSIPLRLLTEMEVAKIHEALVDDFKNSDDPIAPPGLRSEALLGSAVGRLKTTNGPVLKYPTVEMAAAALLHAIVLDHPFHNGNKRTAIVGMLVFLYENKYHLMCTQDELFKLVLLTAQRRLVRDCPTYEKADAEVMHIARWIYDRSRLIESGDRPIQWLHLKRLLGHYNCEWERATGNKLNIRRMKARRRWHIPEEYQTQVSCRNDGEDAEPDTVAMIRKALKLDAENGVDSRDFYNSAPHFSDAFILKYRELLRKLARL